MKYVMIILLSCYSHNALSFNWDKCSKKWIDNSSWSGEGLFVSTSSFFSSTGECAMIGHATHDRKVFLAHNVDNLKTDFAKGGGQYSFAFAKLYGCDLDSQSYFSQLIKVKYEQLESFEELGDIYSFLNSHFYKNKQLKADCINT